MHGRGKTVHGRQLGCDEDCRPRRIVRFVFQTLKRHSHATVDGASTADVLPKELLRSKQKRARHASNALHARRLLYCTVILLEQYGRLGSFYESLFKSLCYVQNTEL